MSNLSQIFVGVDVAKNHLDLHLYPHNKDMRVANSDVGIGEIIRLLSGYKVKQIVLEPTGGYEQNLVQHCRMAGYSVWQANPSRIRAFIISEGIRAKTDKIDAKMIALFASQKESKLCLLPDAESNETLRSLHRRRADLLKMLTMEKVRVSHPAQANQKKGIEKHIFFLEKQIAGLEKDIKKTIAEHEPLQKKYAIISSVPGVGMVTATALIAEMPELGIASDKQVAAILGVAPMIRQSGQSKGTASICGGRAEVRQIVYMAAVSARMHNPTLRQFYERLIRNSKKPKIALVALMRKLITIINALLRKEEMGHGT